jgi:signal peptidase I
VERPDTSTEVGSQPPIGDVATPPVEPPVEASAEPVEPAEAAAAEAGAAKKAAKNNRKKQGYEWLILVAASLAVALIVRGFLIQAFYIPSESMVPTLVKNDRVLVNKLSYKLHDVHRGDIVVFTAPEGAATAQVKDLIKRVVGLPG